MRRSFAARAEGLEAPLAVSGLVGCQMPAAPGAWCCTGILGHPSHAVSIPASVQERMGPGASHENKGYGG